MLLVQGIESVKKLFLRSFFPGDELNIVHQQHIHGVKTLAEADHAVKAQRVDHLDGEFLRAHVAQPHGRVALLDGVPDSVHQMRLAHAHPAVKEQRVVGFRRVFGHRAGRRMRKFVGLAHHERVEAVAGIELVVARLKIQLGLSRLGQSRGRGRHRFLLAAHVLDLYVGGSELMEHRRDDVPVRAGEHLAENGAGNLNVQDFAFGPAQPCWLEPRRKGVDAHAGLDVVEKLVPGISRFTLTPNLGCRRHR